MAYLMQSSKQPYQCRSSFVGVLRVGQQKPAPCGYHELARSRIISSETKVASCTYDAKVSGPHDVGTLSCQDLNNWCEQLASS